MYKGFSSIACGELDGYVVASWSHLWENCLFINYSLLGLSPSFVSLPLSLSLSLSLVFGASGIS